MSPDRLVIAGTIGVLMVGVATLCAFWERISTRSTERHFLRLAHSGAILWTDIDTMLAEPEYLRLFTGPEIETIVDACDVHDNTRVPLDMHLVVRWLVACRRGHQDRDFFLECIHAGMTTTEMAGHLDRTAPLDRPKVRMLADLAA